MRKVDGSINPNDNSKQRGNRRKQSFSKPLNQSPSQYNPQYDVYVIHSIKVLLKRGVPKFLVRSPKAEGRRQKAEFFLTEGQKKLAIGYWQNSWRFSS